jgi:probable phosphoglycerate mutase
VVTHGGVLDIIYRHVYNLPSSHPRDFLIPNAALNWLRRDADGWQIELWADTRHLQGAALDEI